MCHREVLGEPDAELWAEPESELPGRPTGQSAVRGGPGHGGGQPKGGCPPLRPGQCLPQREHADICVQVRRHGIINVRLPDQLCNENVLIG